MTAHWIDVKNEKWKLRAEVVGFRPVAGEHSGENLGRHFVGLCERVGILDKDQSKVSNKNSNTDKITDNDQQLQTITLDNASNNNTSCETIEQQHTRRRLKWSAAENQLP
jgi:hypothetical protein